MVIGNVRKRKRGMSLGQVDPAVTAETLQSTRIGDPCSRCASTIRLAVGGRCVRCLKQWRRDNEHRYYRKYGSALFRKLGITPADYYDLAESQGWACKICLRIPENKLHVDHCHETNKIRGLLCGGCNVGLGHFSDDPERLTRAIEYLEANK
jgi:hypothetical protein